MAAWRFVTGVLCLFALLWMGATASAETEFALPDTADQVPEFRIPVWSDTTGHPTFQPGDWDSVLAAYDASFEHPNRTHVAPEFDLHYSKAEGVHLEGGLSLRDHRYRLDHLEVRAGYDTGRRRPTGSGKIRFDLHGQGLLMLEASISDRVAPFGNHNPYGNTLLALVGGYDARQYLRAREGSALLVLRFNEERQLGVGWTRVEQRPLRTVSRFHLLGPDYWMTRNEPADDVMQNGLKLHYLRRPTYTEETGRYGLVTLLDGTAFGGRLLRGSREYARLQGDLWYTKKLRDRAAWHLRTSGTIAAGRAPRQAWPDLGGAAGLKAFSPRGLALSDSNHVPETFVGPLVGTSRLFVRAEYQREDKLFPKSGIPLMARAKLQFAPFIEAGAVWGDPLNHPIRRVRDLRLPRGGETHWDVGFGLRRDIDYSGILTHVQVDFAWPMGADTGPVRITLQMSSNWLD